LVHHALRVAVPATQDFHLFLVKQLALEASTTINNDEVEFEIWEPKPFRGGKKKNVYRTKSLHGI
jgi:hypothetical protein